MALWDDYGLVDSARPSLRDDGLSPHPVWMLCVKKLLVGARELAATYVGLAVVLSLGTILLLLVGKDESLD